MQIIFDSKEKSIIRMEKGEEYSEVLKSLALERNLSCTFSMIGAGSLVELGYYHLEEKRYFGREFSSGHIEVASLTGNIAWDGNEPIVHAHGVFSNEKNQCFGGHILRFVISATGEAVIDWLPEKMLKKDDAETGLKLLSK
jgi:uncharacterized protein